MHVYIEDEEIVTTDGHPFYVEGVGFVPSENLETGDIVRLADGRKVPVISIELEYLEEPVYVYNFEVEASHTYYVSELGVLVHNTGCPTDTPSEVETIAMPSKAGKTSYGKSIDNTEFFKENGGLDASDYISIHSRKHMYNPDILSTPKKTQYGKDVNVGKLCEDTIMNPDELIYNIDQNVMIYKKKYPFNISTSETPTGTHRVFIPLNTQGKKTIRMSQFPLFEGN